MIAEYYECFPLPQISDNLSRGFCEEERLESLDSLKREVEMSLERGVVDQKRIKEKELESREKFVMLPNRFEKLRIDFNN